MYRSCDAARLVAIFILWPCWYVKVCVCMCVCVFIYAYVCICVRALYALSCFVVCFFDYERVRMYMRTCLCEYMCVYVCM